MDIQELALTDVRPVGPPLIQHINPLIKAQPQDFELAKATTGMEEVLSLLGFDLDSEHMEDTARRYIKMMMQMSYPEKDIPPSNFTSFEVPKNQDGGIVLQRDIQFSSLCAHHLCPFEGKAHIAYIPNKRMVGLSKLARVLLECAKGPNVQEEIGMATANFIEDHLNPIGVAVIIQATHTCMTMRGVKAHGSETITTQLRGAFFRDARARTEVMNLMQLPRC